MCVKQPDVTQVGGRETSATPDLIKCSVLEPCLQKVSSRCREALGYLSASRTMVDRVRV